MNQLINQVKDSPKARVYILVAFFFITVLIFINTRGEHSPEESEKLVKVERLEMDSLPGEQVVGGLGRESAPTSEVQEAVDKLKPVLEEKTNLKFISLEVISSKTQVVAGHNYFVKAKGKVDNGDEKIVHLRIYKHWKGDLELTQYQLDKKLEDKLEYFQ